eukprot:m.170780 g.170780  ORF g.170780 m.170780 type:complete len:595 (-) comp18269_c0_seq20:254-2038(-)
MLKEALNIQEFGLHLVPVAKYVLYLFVFTFFLDLVLPACFPISNLGRASLPQDCCTIIVFFFKVVNKLDRILFHLFFWPGTQTWLDQQLWPAIIARKPDVWIWAGDNVYLDQKRWGTGPFPIFHETTPEIIEREYKLQLANENYKRLMNTTPILGVWDDHDYGLNDGDRHLGDIRHVTRKALLDFVEHGQHPSLLRPERRTRADGVYTAYQMPTANGPPIGIVLLDTRWNKDKSHLLGEEQWQWLERTLIEFRDSGVAVTFVVSPTQVLGRYRMVPACSAVCYAPGITACMISWHLQSHTGIPKRLLDNGCRREYVLPLPPLFCSVMCGFETSVVRQSYQRPCTTMWSQCGTLVTTSSSWLHVLCVQYVESWQSYPEERDRLMQLFHTANHSTILLSGDVHFAEFSMVQCVADPGEGTLDVAATRAAGGKSVLDVLEVTSSGLTHSWDSPLWRLYLMHLAHAILPFQSSFAYKLEPNFGELDVDWETNSIAVRVFGNGGALLLEHTFDLAQLRPSAPHGTPGTAHLSCAPIRGHVSPVHLVAAYALFAVVALSPLWAPLVALYAIARWLLRDCRNGQSSKQQRLSARSKLGKVD